MLREHVLKVAYRLEALIGNENGGIAQLKIMKAITRGDGPFHSLHI